MTDRVPSYAALLRSPNVLALLAATCLSRLGQRMFLVVVVLFAIGRFHSAALAGWVVFAATAPGLLCSPLAGAFLDRAGARRGVSIDLAVSAAATLALAASDVLNLVTPVEILALVVGYALTSPLSAAGVRVLLPRFVPARALDRANALDTAIHAVVDVVGPSAAGAVVGLIGSGVAFVIIAVAFAAAAACIALLRGLAPPAPPARSLARQAVEALILVLRTPLLRGLAVGYALNNFVWGVLVVTVPVSLARRFPASDWQAMSGLLWAGVGLAGGVGALLAGRFRLIGREAVAMTWCMAATALALWPLSALGVVGLAAGVAVIGLLAGPIDVGLLTLRQRRTEPARLGQVLAVSMSLNTLGFPIGSALGGWIAGRSVGMALLIAALASLAGAAAIWKLIPAESAGR